MHIYYLLAPQVVNREAFSLCIGPLSFVRVRPACCEGPLETAEHLLSLSRVATSAGQVSNAPVLQPRSPIGIGLWLSRQLVELQNGTITAPATGREPGRNSASSSPYCRRKAEQ